MFYLLAPFRFIYKLWFGISFFIILIILYPFFWIFTRSEKTTPAVMFMQKYIWSPIMNICLLVWVHRKGRKNVPKGPVIIVANHTSYHDIVLMYSVYPKYFMFLGKSELAKWPLIKVLFNTGTVHIPVNRKSVTAAARSLQKAEMRLKQGYSIVIFPEGTISKRSPYLYKFKSGAFNLAIKTGTPILPITFLDNWALMSEPHKLFGTARPGICRAIIHKPISTKHLTDKDILPLQNEVFDIFEKDLTKFVYPRIKGAWLRPTKK